MHLGVGRAPKRRERAPTCCREAVARISWETITVPCQPRTRAASRSQAPTACCSRPPHGSSHQVERGEEVRVEPVGGVEDALLGERTRGCARARPARTTCRSWGCRRAAGPGGSGPRGDGSVRSPRLHLLLVAGRLPQARRHARRRAPRPGAGGSAAPRTAGPGPPDARAQGSRRRAGRRLTCSARSAHQSRCWRARSGRGPGRPGGPTSSGATRPRTTSSRRRPARPHAEHRR